MTIAQAEAAIRDAAIKTFWKFMEGQTLSMDENGWTVVPDRDVDRFIRYKCDPKNEPLIEVD